MKNGEGWCSHPAWDHWGSIWFEDGQFHEEVMVYGSVKKVISADTIEEVFNLVNEEFGTD